MNDAHPQAPRRRRLRRPLQRARDLVRHRRERAAGDRPRGVRRGAGRHRHRRPLGARVRRPGAAARSRARPAARGRRRPARRSRSPGTATRTDLVVTEPSDAAAHARRGRRRLPAAARPVGRGRHDPGACSRWPACATSAPACSPRAVGMDKAYMKVVLRGGRAAGAAVGDDHRPRVGAPTPTACRERVGRARLPGVREARPRRLQHRHHQGARRLRARRGHRGGAARTTPRCSSRRRRGGREVECGVLAGARRRPPETSVPAEITVGGDHEFYDFAAKYLPEEAHRARRPRRPARRRRRPVRDAGRPGLRGASAARAWPGSTSSCCPTARWSSTRSTRCPASRRVDVPADVGRHRLDYPALVDRLIQLALARDTGLR